MSSREDVKHEMGEVDDAFFKTFPVKRYQEGRWQEVEDRVLVEVPVALIYNGYPHVVVMCTPHDLVDFIYGFSVTEGIIKILKDVQSIKLVSNVAGIEAHIEIDPLCFARVEGRKRQMSARTGCGICGIDSLTDVVREQGQIEFEYIVNEAAIDTALKGSFALQLMNQETGGAHAAFFVSSTGSILLTREDVGRHVALDKLIGAMLQQEVDAASGFILTTSRASFEMVQKAVAARVGLLVTMSAPTTMAIELAKSMNLKLAAFTRVGKINLYRG